jgi:hypothetical protein
LLRLFQPRKPEIMQTLCIPLPADSSSFPLQNSRTNLPVGAFTADELEAGRQTRADKLAKWASLDLRQDFADETFMRNHIKAAGLRAPNWAEPASTSRLRTLLHHAGVDAPEANEAVGTTLSGYHKLNLNLPLWSALALVLEATGQFTVAASGVTV